MRGTKPGLKTDDAAIQELLPAPAWLNEDARAEWDRMFPSLAARRILTEGDLGDMLLIYGREHAPGRVAPERIGYAIQALLPFWGALNASDIKGETCRRYCAQRHRVLKGGRVLPISNGTLRRELNVLQAAANYCHKEGYLTTSVKVALPEKPPARDRWLTQDEVARLIRSARRTSKGRHLARFILLSIYTGTRKTAVLGLGFVRNTTGGWIDLDQGVMYRRGTEECETAKLRKPVKMPRKLLAHCRRWRANGAIWAVEVDGARVADIQTAFDGARLLISTRN